MMVRRVPLAVVLGLSFGLSGSACAPPDATGALRLPDPELTFVDLDAALAAAPRQLVLRDGAARLTLPGAVAVRIDDRLSLERDGKVAELALVGFGRPGRSVAPGHAEPVVEGTRVLLDRGPLVEWFSHQPTGVEHGFSVRERPAGAGPLVVELALTGELQADAEAGGVVWRGGNGDPVARYAGLVAADARGAPLASRFTADCANGDCVVLLTVEDEDATYPLWIDPLVSSVVADVVPADAAAGVGASVALDGDWAAVGCPGTGAGDGITVLLERNVGNPDGWGVADTLTSADASFGDQVALDYPYLAIGAPDADAVSVYQHQQGGWTSIHRETKSNGRRFGAAVDLDLPYLAVGSPENGNGQVDMFLVGDGDVAGAGVLTSATAGVAGFGAAVAVRWPYLFVGAPDSDGGDGAVIVLDTTGDTRDVLTGSTASAGFGATLDVTSERLVVGSRLGHQVDVYALEPGLAVGDDLAVSLDASILPPAVADGPFGTSVALFGDTLAVADGSASAAKVHTFTANPPGAVGWVHAESLDVGGPGPVSVALSSRNLLAGVPGASAAGQVRVWGRDGKSWASLGVLSDVGLPRFGTAVAIDGDVVVVGDPTAATTWGGSAQVFERQATGSWLLTATLAPTGAAAGSGFGSAVAISGDLIAVGAPQDDPSGTIDAGQLWWWRRSGDAWVLGGAVPPPSRFPLSRFGASLAIDGQLMVVGEPLQAGGRVHAYVMSSAYVLSPPTTYSVNAQVGGLGGTVQLGSSVAAEGTRIVAGRQGLDDAGRVDVGGAMVFEYVAGLPPQLVLRDELVGDVADGRCGVSAALEADRVALGCDNNGGVSPGEVRVYRTDGDVFIEEARIQGGVGENFGGAIAMNADRVVVGSKGTDKVQFFGRNQPTEGAWGELAEFVVTGDPASRFGAAVALDASTLVVGAPNRVGGGQVTAYGLDQEVPPTATDDSYVVNEDTPLILPILANDWDGNGTVISLADVDFADPPNGTVNQFTFLYTPDPNFFGSDSFTYFVTDVDTGDVSRTATVSITVVAVNDPPDAFADTYFPVEDQPYSGASVLSNDRDVEDGTAITAVLVSGPAHAQSFSMALDGSFTYVPQPNFAGVDSFQYQAVDTAGVRSAVTLVTLEVEDRPEQPVLDDSTWTTRRDVPLDVAAPGLAAPASQLPGAGVVFSVANDFGLAGTVVVDPSGAFRFAPAAGFVGITSFQVLADYQGATDTATVFIDVQAVDDVAPVIVPDAYRGVEDELVVVSARSGLLVNDADADGDAIEASMAPPLQGTLISSDPDGSFTWRPPANASGTFTLTYTIRANGASVGPADVTIDVAPVNDAPTAVPDRYDLSGLAPLVVEAVDGVLGNDVDVDGDPLSAVLAEPARHVDIALEPDGSFTVGFREPYRGEDRFTYRVADGLGGLSAAAEVVLELQPELPEGPTGDTGGSTAVHTGAPCAATWFPDRDGDGFGDVDGAAAAACDAPEGYTAVVGDCDDAAADRYPGATEVSGDGVDQDCDGRDAEVTPAGACAHTSGAAFGAWVLLVPWLRRRGR